MGRKKKKSKGDLLENIIDEKIEEGIQKKISPISPEDLLGEETDEDKELNNSFEDDVASDLLSTIPQNQGFYFKIYKTKPLPADINRPQFKKELLDLDGIDDLEVHIRNLARDNNWGPGEYLVMTFKKDGRGTKRAEFKPRKFFVDYDLPVKEGIADPSSTLKEKISEFGDMIKWFKEFGNNNSSQFNPDTISKTLAESFQAGVNLTKGLMPVEKEVKQTSQTEQINEILTLLQKCGIQIGTPSKVEKPEVDPQEQFIRTIKMLKELNVIPSPQEREEKGDETQTLIEKLNSLTDLAERFNLNEKSSASPLTELIRVIGPQIPKIIENVTDAIGKVAEVSKLKLENNLGVPPGGRSHVFSPNIPVKNPSPSLPTGEAAIPNREMNPLVKELKDAIDSNNVSFYPRLREIMLTFVGSQVLEDLILEKIPAESFLKSMSMMLKEDFLLEEIAQIYLNNFLKSLRDERLKSLVIVKCENCNEEYEFPDEASYEEDSKVCESCGGTLKKVIMEGNA